MKGKKGKKGAGIGLGVAALVGLGLWLWSKSKAKATPTATLDTIKAKSQELGRPLTTEEANVIIFTPEELKSGVSKTTSVEKDILIPAIQEGLITMTQADINFWLGQDVYYGGGAVYIPWSDLEAKAAEVSQVIGMDIGAGEMREVARMIEVAREKASPEVAAAAAKAGVSVETYVEEYAWRLAYEEAKVAEAAALGIETTGRPKREIIAELEATTANRPTPTQEAASPTIPRPLLNEPAWF